MKRSKFTASAADSSSIDELLSATNSRSALLLKSSWANPASRNIS